MITGKINWLKERPAERTLKRTLLLGILLLVITAPATIWVLELSNFPGTLDETQLGFDGEYIRACFSTMTGRDLSYFVLANLVDYLFMVSYAAVLTSAALLLTRRLRVSRLRGMGLAVSLAGALAALSDAAENVFIISMASDPLSFPGWLAIPHSLFAHLKFNLMYVAAGWIGLTALLGLVTWIQGRTTSLALVEEKVTVI
jgi:hypothetical protein